VRLDEVIAGRFELEAEQASGGMGRVYRARDRQTGAVVAVKILQFGSELDADRFSREASLLAQVSHPGIVRYLAHGQVSQGQFLAMEWIDGETLKDRLVREGLTIVESVQLAKQVALALGEMHSRGIIHRDIKPSNLMFVRAEPDRVKILDFGIARRSDDLVGLTRTGFMVGSPGYMAPEQARGNRSPVDHRTDLFALGCVLYECLTGRPPFFGDPVAVRAKVLLFDPPRVRELNPEVSAQLSALVVQLLSKDQQRRPLDASELASQLDGLREVAGGRRKQDVVDSQTAATASLRPQRSPSDAPAAARAQLTFLLSTGADLSGARTPSQEALDASIAAHGGKLETVDGGWWMVLFPPSSEGTSEQAARAAHCALKLRALLPDAPMILVAEPADSDLDGLIDRVVKTLTSDSVASLFSQALSTAAPVEGIRLDQATAALLKPPFEVTSTPNGLYLRGLEGARGPQA